MASHPPLYSLVLDLNIHPPHALSGCFPVIRPQGPACSSLSPVRPFPCPFLLPHLSPPSVYYITGLGGYAHFCRCDPCFFVLSYPGKFLGPSVGFFLGGGVPGIRSVQKPIKSDFRVSDRRSSRQKLWVY